MKSFLLFTAACLGMFSLVPLSVLAATGKWRRVWEATRGYALCLLLVIGIPAVIGAVIALLGVALGIDPSWLGIDMN